MSYPTSAFIIGITDLNRPCLVELCLGTGYESSVSARRTRQFNTGCSSCRAISWMTVRAGTGAGLQFIIGPRTEKYYRSGLGKPRLQEAVAQHLAPGSGMRDLEARIRVISAVTLRVDRYESKRRAVS